MLKTIILLMLLYSGVVFSVPENPREREQYTASLNSMASIVMNWYGTILDTENRYTDSSKPDYWQDYITQFPAGITQIEITGTDLVKPETGEQYQFIVDIKFRNKHENKIHTQTMSNTFLFGFDLSEKIILQKITSTEATIAETQPSEVIADNKFTYSYFTNRAVAYAWLSYLDGSVMPEDIKNQFDQVSYSLTIGNQSWQDTARSVRNERQPYLAVGGHLLRLVKAESKDQISDIQVLYLTIEWRGVDKDGTPVWANIQQRIEYKLLKNGDWEIILVKEKHLLPNTEPWIGLLC